MTNGGKRAAILCIWKITGFQWRKKYEFHEDPLTNGSLALFYSLILQYNTKQTKMTCKTKSIQDGAYRSVEISSSVKWGAFGYY